MKEYISETFSKVRKRQSLTFKSNNYLPPKVESLKQNCWFYKHVVWEKQGPKIYFSCCDAYFFSLEVVSYFYMISF